MKHISMAFTDEELSQLYAQKTKFEMPEQGKIKLMNWKDFVMELSTAYKKLTEEKEK